MLKMMDRYVPTYEEQKLFSLSQLHQEYLKIASQLTIDGEYEEAESVQEKADAIWNEIKNMLVE